MTSILGWRSGTIVMDFSVFIFRNGRVFFIFLFFSFKISILLLHVHKYEQGGNHNSVFSPLCFVILGPLKYKVKYHRIFGNSTIGKSNSPQDKVVPSSPGTFRVILRNRNSFRRVFVFWDLGLLLNSFLFRNIIGFRSNLRLRTTRTSSYVVSTGRRSAGIIWLVKSRWVSQKVLFIYRSYGSGWWYYFVLFTSHKLVSSVRLLFTAVPFWTGVRTRVYCQSTNYLHKIHPNVEHPQIPRLPPSFDHSRISPWPRHLLPFD